MGNVKTGDVIEYHFKQELLNNKWLIDGIDWHTKEGKSAIQDFIAEETELKKYLLTLGIYENLDIVIGLLLFKTIGQEVDKRLFYPTAVMAAKLSKKLEIENMTIYELARKTYTSPATIVRLAKKLGYEGYEALKKIS